MGTARTRPRRASPARWVAVLGFGFVVGAALVMLTDSAPTSSVAAAPPVAAPPSGTPYDATAPSAGGTERNGQHIHRGKAQDVAAEGEPDQPLDAATRTLLADQLTVARQHALAYPTVADALAAGYRLAGGFAPGSGAHYIGGPITGSGPFDPNAAQSLIYDGTSPTSRVVGLW
jgi:hypothetical protein